jgi:hypothetical protein
MTLREIGHPFDESALRSMCGSDDPREWSAALDEPEPS